MVKWIDDSQAHYPTRVADQHDEQAHIFYPLRISKE